MIGNLASAVYLRLYPQTQGISQEVKDEEGEEGDKTARKFYAFHTRAALANRSQLAVISRRALNEWTQL